ncbi:succinate dehydrogenase cytochrome b subunit [Pedobacter xixiisoli]|uniref:Succinate dehydrogenase / fumarate reductase cytochrome b subunit n=1 Tax=Pedobacter xixiisoli TaxID=1476464 RepID=A0A286ACN8_9SPHI|nr:succinate dehydrogenase cytochrome b subunit [Pedobacter xixiisoli]SOD19672.1 succinate dehydrogenase / fumarate reductase cytochrome b subunit [Pedobacter xixiisoli]
MSSLSKAFTSSIGRKFVMGLTGLFLISFLLIHVSINALIFLNDSGETFNVAADFMGHNIVIRIMEVGLFAGIILHIVQAIMLTAQNNAARPEKYAYNKASANSKWYSRSMGLLGTLILMFLVLHLYHFWWPTKVAVYTHQEHNTFQNIVMIFQELWVVVVYVLGVISLGYHLLHGFQSSFQTMGWNHKKWTPVVKTVGVWFSIIVPIIFALMPISIYLGWIG